ncbi:MAG: response regulator [Sphingomonas sp.]
MTEPLAVLIVEDEPLIAMMLEDFVDMLGHTVAGSVDSVPDAIAAVDSGGFDLAILDVHLRGEACWPVADALADRGLPFLVSTGGHTEPPPARHAAAPSLPKPYTMDGVEKALKNAASGPKA